MPTKAAAVLIAAMLALPLPGRGRASAAADGACLAFRGVTLIDGTGAAPRPDATVVVSGERISWVGDAREAPEPAGCTVVDGRGRFLIPGLWDMHVHVSKLGETALPLFVANGVTGVRDMGSDLAEVLRLRAQIAAGERIGPRILTPGPMLESAARVEQMRAERPVEPIERTRVGIATPADADREVARLAAAGVDFIKVRTFASLEAYHAIAAAAARAGLALVGHADRIPPDDLVKAGQRSIEHIPLPLMNEKSEAERLAVFARWAQAGIAAVATLGNGRDSLFVPAARAAAIVADPRGEIDWRRRFVSEHLLADWREQVEERRRSSPDWTALAPAIQRNFREMRRAGMRFLPGTDAAVLLKYPGFSLHDELELMVELGLSPMETLVAATRHSCELLGLGDRLGTVEAGKLADLVLLDGDPLASIANTRRIAAVVARGRHLDRAARDRLLAVPGAPAG